MDIWFVKILHRVYRHTLYTWKSIPKYEFFSLGPRTSSWNDKGSALFAHPDQSTLYRLGGNRFNKGFMTLNCKLEDCESCAADDCVDQWKVLSTSILTIARKFPGFTLIPDEMASNCPICKTKGVEESIDPQTAL